MAAAVADYTPAAAAPRRSWPRPTAPLTLTLQRTHGHPRRPRRRCARGSGAAGRCWSASPPKPTTSWREAREKRARKQVDLIVANDVSQPDRGFDVDDQRRDASSATTATSSVPLQSKERVAAVDPRSRRDAAPRSRGGSPRSARPDRARRPAASAHLEFFGELGVDGVRREPEWRTRAEHPRRRRPTARSGRTRPSNVKPPDANRAHDR